MSDGPFSGIIHADAYVFTKSIIKNYNIAYIDQEALLKMQNTTLAIARSCQTDVFRELCMQMPMSRTGDTGIMIVHLQNDHITQMLLYTKAEEKHSIARSKQVKYPCKNMCQKEQQLKI